MIRPTLAIALYAPLGALLGSLLTACTQVPPPGANANTPGFTGTTIVPGNNSTLAGNADATYQQQKWGITPGRR